MIKQIPLNGAGITLEQYQKYTMIADDDDKEFVGHKMLNIFLDIPMNEVRSIPQSQAEELVKDITDAMDEMPPLDYTFEFNGTTYGFIPDLEELTLGEYIDLEEYLVKPIDWHKAAAVLFRPVKDKVGQMYNIEPYRGSKGDHEVMKSLPASQFVNATLFFLPFKQSLVSTFSYLFGEAKQEDEGEGLVDLSFEGQFSKRWGWFGALHSLSGSDATNFRKSTKINIYDALTWLSYEKDRSDTENKIMKRNRR